MISTDLFIATCGKDFPYLKYCLLSIAKFAKRFNYLRVLVPANDAEAAEKLIAESNIPFPAKAYGHCEPEGKGFLWHMRQIMHADTFTDAERIAHLDSDCIFTNLVEPDDFAVDGKIILRYEPFATINKRHPAMMRWQECTQACLRFPVLYETMRCHPGVFHRSTYELTRKCMEIATGHPVDDYILSCENAFPQTFCEFNTLGNVAMEKQRDLYHPVLQRNDKPDPPNNLQQMWSHGAPDIPQHIWVEGIQRTIIPIDFINEILARETPVPRWMPTPEDEERMTQ